MKMWNEVKEVPKIEREHRIAFGGIEVGFKKKSDFLKFARQLGFNVPEFDEGGSNNSNDYWHTVLMTGWFNIYDKQRRHLYGHWVKTDLLPKEQPIYVFNLYEVI